MRNALIVVAMLLALSSVGLAQEAVEEGPQYTVFSKLFRGIGNVILAPFEVPVSMFNVAADTDVFIGIGVGSVAGGAACVERAVAGGVDVVTFLFPPYDRALVTYEVGKSPAAQAAASTFPGPESF
jgi:putative exosortase-associated protein (TIGR04073 family)